MRVLAITFVYNEIALIADAVKYYRNQGCDVYVIDNMSDDGTWEWLQENNIPSSRCDTAGAFQLNWLQAEMIRILHILKPDWFIWFSPDLYHVFTSNIHDTICNAESKSFNQIISSCYCFKNTGETELPVTKLQDLISKYHYAKCERVCLISKYSPELKIAGDSIFVPEANQMQIGVILEYGACKPKEVQELKLLRRKKAWDQQALPKNYGIHYVNGKTKNWISEKADLINTQYLSQCIVAVNFLKHRIHESE